MSGLQCPSIHSSHNQTVIGGRKRQTSLSTHPTNLVAYGIRLMLRRGETKGEVDCRRMGEARKRVEGRKEGVEDRGEGNLLCFPHLPD